MRSFPLRGSLVVVAMAASLLIQPLRAQDRTAVPIQVRPTGSMDSVQKGYHDALWTMRDTVGSVRWALGQLQRDPASVSRETVVSRAMVLTERCRSLERLAAASESTFDPARAPAKPARTKSAAAQLVQAMRTLRTDLDALCIKGFAATGPGVRADTLRAWAGFRGTQVEHALQKYERVVTEFTTAADFRLGPAVPKR